MDDERVRYLRVTDLTLEFSRKVKVNTAGIWVEGRTEDTTEEDWDRVLDVNLKGTFFACSRAIPELKKTQGCIVNLSSDAGLVGTPETAVYTASKGGVSLLTKSLAWEPAPPGLPVARSGSSRSLAPAGQSPHN